MANRVPVEEVRQTAQLRPVAAPVGAYVRMPNWAISDSMAQSRFKAATAAFQELTGIGTKILDISDDQYEQDQGIAAFADFQRWKATRDTSKDNAGNPEDVLNNINQQFSDYFGDETRGTRRKVLDRVYQEYSSSVVGARTQEAARETLERGIDDIFVAATPDFAAPAQAGKAITDPNHPAYKQSIDTTQAVFAKLSEKVGPAKANDILAKRAQMQASQGDFSMVPWLFENKRHLTQSNADEFKDINHFLTKPTESEQLDVYIGLNKAMESMSIGQFSSHVRGQVAKGLISAEKGASLLEQKQRKIGAENDKVLLNNAYINGAAILMSGGSIADVAKDTVIDGKVVDGNKIAKGAVLALTNGLAKQVGYGDPNPSQFVTPVKDKDGNVTFKPVDNALTAVATQNNFIYARSNIRNEVWDNVLSNGAYAFENVNNPQREYVVNNGAALYDYLSSNNPSYIAGLPKNVQEKWAARAVLKRERMDDNTIMQKLSQSDLPLPEGLTRKVREKVESVAVPSFWTRVTDGQGAPVNKKDLEQRLTTTATTLGKTTQSTSAGSVVEQAKVLVEANSVHVGGTTGVYTTALMKDDRMYDPKLIKQLGRPFEQALAEYGAAYYQHYGKGPVFQAMNMEGLAIRQDSRDPMMFNITDKDGTFILNRKPITVQEILDWDTRNKAIQNKSVVDNANANLKANRGGK